jgi:TolB-like protein
MRSPSPSTSAATSATRSSRSGKGEDIITELSRFQRLFVIARHTSFTYKGAQR